MTVVVAKQSYTFYDAKQQSARTTMYLDYTGTPGDIAANGEFIGKDMAALSNSSVEPTSASIRANGPFTSAPTPVSPGAASNYQDVADKAVFVFQDAAGGLHKYQVACPKTAIFLADQETIDFTNTAVKAFVADMTFATFGGTAPQGTQGAATREGNLLVSSVGGYRRRGRTPRKFNIFTRNPTLTGEGE